MRRIRVKNFGPIRDGLVGTGEDGWLEIRKITVFIGNQGSGKSTVAKLISTLTWIEKALVRGDYPTKEFTNHHRFVKKYCSYHKLDNYFKDLDGQNLAEIEYEGIAYRFEYRNQRFTIEKLDGNRYLLPQIMYVPAERNFISTIDNPKMIKLSSGPLLEFLSEFDNAKQEIKGTLQLPLNQTKLEYDRLNDILNLRGDSYKIRLTEASSGYQSSVPLFLVSRYLAYWVKIRTENERNEMSSDELKRFRIGVEAIWNDKEMTEERRRVALSALASKFTKSCFINIVEKPEQNLSPSSQRKMLSSLLEYANLTGGNELVITTHSPYIISYLTLAIKGFSLLDNIRDSNEALRDRFNDVVAEASCVSSEKVAIYELTEDGKIILLSNFEGVPSDKNFLNEQLEQSNHLFDELLEIEVELGK